MDKKSENNQVSIVGEIVSDFKFSHEVSGEKFYMVDVVIERRLSSHSDCIPLMISERLINVNTDYIGQNIGVTGQLCSPEQNEGNKDRLVLSVFVTGLEFLSEIGEDIKSNQIFLDGYIFEKPIFKKSPLGREITEFVIEVNRSSGKSDYIPCICWGRNARLASKFEVGGHVAVSGRIQSREYVELLSKTEAEKRIVYEVSVSNLELLLHNQ